MAPRLRFAEPDGKQGSDTVRTGFENDGSEWEQLRQPKSLASIGREGESMTKEVAMKMELRGWTWETLCQGGRRKPPGHTRLGGRIKWAWCLSSLPTPGKKHDPSKVE